MGMAKKLAEEVELGLRETNLELHKTVVSKLSLAVGGDDRRTHAEHGGIGRTAAAKGRALGHA